MISLSYRGKPKGSHGSQRHSRVNSKVGCKSGKGHSKPENKPMTKQESDAYYAAIRAQSDAETKHRESESSLPLKSYQTNAA
jgi:hypothetical protein